MKPPLIGKTTILRDAVEEDLEAYSRWMREGEWLDFDAPWEKMSVDTATSEDRFRKSFLGELSDPRSRLIIQVVDGPPIGWVAGYVNERFPASRSIGIDICEDNYLNRGHGTEALRLWIDYLFNNLDIHRIAFATYSFNKRVYRVGEKLGFMWEGADREIVHWDGQWIDRLHFSLLRREWEQTRG